MTPVRIALLWFLLALAWPGPAADASVLVTSDPAEVAAFQAGRTVLGFDEIVVPPSPAPCFVTLDPNEYLALGIVISADADGQDQTHVARLPECGTFGPTLTPPNVIGGGVNATTGWREAVRFDFPGGAEAIGAHNDGTGSNTTLTAYAADDSVIASATGDQGLFMGIVEPDIAYAVWTWNFDQSVQGFSLDNVTFQPSPEPTTVPALGLHGLAVLAGLLGAAGCVRARSPRPGGCTTRPRR